jgi:Tfp pilus assembly protein PilF
VADTPKRKNDPVHFKNVADALTLAADLRHRREFVGAEKLYREIIATDRKSAAAYYGLAMVLYRTARHDKAIRCFKAAIALAPRRAEYANKLGEAHLLSRSVDEAEAVFQRAINRGAADTVTYTSLSAIHIWNGDADKAKDMLCAGVSRHPIMPGDSEDGRRPTLLRLRGAENAHCRPAAAYKRFSRAPHFPRVTSWMSTVTGWLTSWWARITF